MISPFLASRFQVSIISGTNTKGHARRWSQDMVRFFARQAVEMKTTIIILPRTYVNHLDRWVDPFIERKKPQMVVHIYVDGNQLRRAEVLWVKGTVPQGIRQSLSNFVHYY